MWSSRVDSILSRFGIMIDDWQTDVLNERHWIHFDVRRHLVDDWLRRHLFQLVEDDVGRLVGEMLLDALVLEMVRSVASMEFRNGSLVVLLVVFAVGVILLLLLLLLLIILVEHNALLAQILFKTTKFNLKSISISLSSSSDSHLHRWATRRRFDARRAQQLR